MEVGSSGIFGVGSLGDQQNILNNLKNIKKGDIKVIKLAKGNLLSNRDMLPIGRDKNDNVVLVKVKVLEKAGVATKEQMKAIREAAFRFNNKEEQLEKISEGLKNPDKALQSESRRTQGKENEVRKERVRQLTEQEELERAAEEIGNPFYSDDPSEGRRL